MCSSLAFNMTARIFHLLGANSAKFTIGRLTCNSLLNNFCFRDSFGPIRLCTSLALVNEYPVSENMYARSIIESKPQYSDIISKRLGQRSIQIDNDNEVTHERYGNFSEMSPLELCECFEKLSASTSIPISHPSLDNLRLSLKKNCQNFTDEQLASVMKNLSHWNLGTYSKASFFSELCCEFDKICFARWKNWNTCQIFLFLDLWYGLNLQKSSNFFFKAATKLAHNPQNLTPNQVVLLLFHLNLLRTATKNAKMFELEFRLQEVASELTIDELGVAVMGFFKADKCLSNEKLMEHLIERIINEIKTVPDITFTCIMKALRKSIPTSLWPRLGSLFDAIAEEVPRLSVQSCIHAGLVTTRPQYLHKPLISKISQKIVDNISKCRLKDMEKVIFPLAQLAYNPETKPCIFHIVLEELEKPERIVEIEMYPKSFIALIHYLCLKGIYPDKFIKKVLDMDFIQRVYGKYKYTFGREVLCIDSGVELEYPSYTGPRLPLGIRNYLSKRYSEYLPDPNRKLSRHKQWHLEIIQTAEMLFGKEFTAVKYLLPSHPRPDIVVRLDENMSPLPLADSLINAEDFCGPLRAPNTNYYALLVASKNIFLYNSKIPSGETESKIKQLKLIGYTPIIIVNDHWPSKSTYDKVQYLKKIISQAAQSSQVLK